MLDNRPDKRSDKISYRISIITLDSHNAMPCKRAWSNLLEDFDGLEVSIFAAAVEACSRRLAQGSGQLWSTASSVGLRHGAGGCRN